MRAFSRRCFAWLYNSILLGATTIFTIAPPFFCKGHLMLICNFGARKKDGRKTSRGHSVRLKEALENPSAAPK